MSAHSSIRDYDPGFIVGVGEIVGVGIGVGIGVGHGFSGPSGMHGVGAGVIVGDAVGDGETVCIGITVLEDLTEEPADFAIVAKPPTKSTMHVAINNRDFIDPPLVRDKITDAENTAFGANLVHPTKCNLRSDRTSAKGGLSSGHRYGINTYLYRLETNALFIKLCSHLVEDSQNREDSFVVDV